jgi:hypothetical protein
MTTVIDKLLSDLPIWQVRFSGDFLGFQGRGKAGHENFLMREFDLAGEKWFVAAVYSCGQGLVVDFCKIIEHDVLSAFMRKWNLSSDNLEASTCLNEEQRIAMMVENPFSSGLRVYITVNELQLEPSYGFGESWNPLLVVDIANPDAISGEEEFKHDMLFDEEHLEDELDYLKPALAVLSHYDLDQKSGWLFWRQAYHWSGSRKPKIKKIRLNISLEPTQIVGPDLGSLEEGTTVAFNHPVTGVEHNLRVERLVEQVIPAQAFSVPGLEFPPYYTQLVYSITPDLPEDTCVINDCAHGDEPRIVSDTSNLLDDDNAFLPKAEATASIGIIGGAGGPTSIFISSGNDSKNDIRHHSACSSLRFQPTKIVNWRMTFRYYDPSARTEIEI